MRQDDRKFFTAIPAGNTSWALMFCLTARATRRSTWSPGLVPIGVVEFLEVIDIRHQQCKAAPALLGLVDNFFKRVLRNVSGC